MREIKFRAWDTETNNWVEGVTLTLHCSGNLVNVPENMILTQWTGLQDRNKKDIYEGDILKGEENYTALIEAGFSTPDISLCLVKEADGDRFALMTKADHLKIIGNIYEHPDLLK